MTGMKFLSKFTNIFKSKNDDFFCLRKCRSGLSVNLFIDNSGSWYNKKEECYVIKFQNDNNEDAIYKHSIPLSINEEPKILKEGFETSLKDKEIVDLKVFVKKNKEKLIKVATKEIDIFDFLKLLREK